MQNSSPTHPLDDVVDELLRQEAEDAQTETATQETEVIATPPDVLPQVPTYAQPVQELAVEHIADSEIPQHIPIGKAAEMVGVSIDTLRRWDKSGKVQSYRSPGGHRYFLQSDLEEVFGTKYERGNLDIPENAPVGVTEEVSAAPAVILEEPVHQAPANPDPRPHYEIVEEPADTVAAPEAAPTPIVAEAQVQPQPQVQETDSPSFVGENDQIKIKNILEPSSAPTPNFVEETPRVGKGMAVLERIGIIGIVLFVIVDAILALLYFTASNLLSPLTN